MKSTYAFMATFVAVAAFGVVSDAGATGTSTAVGSAWSSVNTSQTQFWGGATGNRTVEAAQKTDSVSAVYIDDQAAAYAKNSAIQTEEGKGTKGEQHQKTSSTVNVDWERNKWPSWTTAKTTGGVWQNQAIWSAQPVEQNQYAGTWQKSEVGDTKSVAEANIVQKNEGATGDVAQRQDLIASTQSSGYTNPWFPKSLTFDFGGKLRQIVSVDIENILNF